MYDLGGILSGQLHYTKICIMSWSMHFFGLCLFYFFSSGQELSFKKLQKAKKKKNHSLYKTKKFDSTKISTEVPKVLNNGAYF